MLHAATPVLIVDRIADARRHYSDGLGFRELSVYRLDPSRDDPAYLVLQRDHAVIHVSSFPGDGTLGGHVSIRVDDVDAMHAELVSRGVAIAMPPTDQDWGVREMVVRDPAGNRIAFKEPR